MLVTELLSNSLEYALSSGAGNIAVVLQRGEDRKLSLIVSDDGHGARDPQTPSDVHKTGLGAKIISGLVAQLGGTMAMRSENGTHTEIRIAEPVLSRARAASPLAACKIAC